MIYENYFVPEDAKVFPFADVNVYSDLFPQTF